MSSASTSGTADTTPDGVDVDVDVVVIGLGPVGSTLTALLGQRGISVIGLDRESGIYPHPRAAHIDHTGLRVLQALGLLDAVLPTMVPNPGIEFVSADGAEIFAIMGIESTASGLPRSMYFDQPVLDQLLRDTAAKCRSVQLLLDSEVVAVDDLPHGATVTVVDRDETKRHITARWIVACDGASGRTRESIGIEVEEWDWSERWIVADVTVTATADHDLPAHMRVVCDPTRPYATAPLPHARRRLELMVLPGEDEQRLIHDGVVTEILGKHVDRDAFEVLRTSAYTFRGRLARRWRQGHVLLCGDAAHVTPPSLGQGMCAGLRDAASLAWRLALVLNGGRPDLLESFELEQSAMARRVIDASVALGELTCELDRARARARDERMIADPARARAEFGFAMPSLPAGPLIGPGGGRPFPQVSSASGLQFDDAIGVNFFVLARSEHHFGTSAGWWRDQAGAVLAVPTDYPEVADALVDCLDRGECDVIVVRPDRYVLARTNELDKITEVVRPLLERHVPPASAAQRTAS